MGGEKSEEDLTPATEGNAFNTGLTLYHLHNVITSLDIGFRHDQIIDPWMAKGRPRVRAAFDLIINTRMLYVYSAGEKGANGVVKDTTPKVARHLEHLQNPHLPRGRSIARHLTRLSFLYIFDHTLLSFLVSPGLTQLTIPADGVLTTFVTSTAVTIPYLGVLSPFVLYLSVQLVVFFIVLTSLMITYHYIAVFFLLLGWEPETWDLDLMYRPWGSDSLFDFWGRRWHQVLRHQLVLLSTLTCKALRLPRTPAIMVSLAFIFSATAHVVGELNMYPVPTTWKIGSFFLLHGAACLLEGLFKAITGHRVGGHAGRVWFLIVMFATSRLAVEAWLDAGMAACFILPKPGPGVYIAKWALTFIDIRPRVA